MQGISGAINKCSKDYILEILPKKYRAKLGYPGN